MFKKYFGVLLITISTTSFALNVCDFNELSQNLKNIYSHFTDTADKIDSNLSGVCFRQLQRVNRNYDTAYYNLKFKRSYSGSLIELNKLLENFSVYMHMKHCPGKNEFASVIKETLDFSQLIKQCI